MMYLKYLLSADKLRISLKMLCGGRDDFVATFLDPGDGDSLIDKNFRDPPGLWVLAPLIFLTMVLFLWWTVFWHHNFLQSENIRSKIKC